MSVSNRNAQSFEKCGTVSEPGTHLNAFYAVLDRLKSANNPLYYILYLQLHYGLRISEVLDIKGSHYHGFGKLLVGGKKFSNNRYIVVNEIKHIFEQMQGLNTLVFAEFNRFFVYREYKKLGLQMFLSGNNKIAVTHSPRHLLFQSAKVHSVSNTDLQAFIGHKSIKSTEHYATKKIKRNNN